MLDTLNESVAAELRAAAARRTVTRAQVARNLDLDPMYVHRRFTAAADISVADFVRLSYGIGVEPLDVLAQVLTDHPDQVAVLRRTPPMTDDVDEQPAASAP